MENFNDIVTTVQITLLVLAVPVVRVLLSWCDLLEAQAYREEEAANRDHTLAIVAMVESGIIEKTGARAMLVDGEGGDE